MPSAAAPRSFRRIAAAIRSNTTRARNSVVVLRPLNAGLVVEVPEIQLGDDRMQHLGRAADVDDDAVGVELGPAELDVDDIVAPCSRCAGPNTSPLKLCAIIMWSRTDTLYIAITPAGFVKCGLTMT